MGRRAHCSSPELNYDGRLTPPSKGSNLGKIPTAFSAYDFMSISVPWLGVVHSCHTIYTGRSTSRTQPRFKFRRIDNVRETEPKDGEKRKADILSLRRISKRYKITRTCSHLSGRYDGNFNTLTQHGE